MDARRRAADAGGLGRRAIVRVAGDADNGCGGDGENKEGAGERDRVPDVSVRDDRGDSGDGRIVSCAALKRRGGRWRSVARNRGVAGGGGGNIERLLAAFLDGLRGCDYFDMA